MKKLMATTMMAALFLTSIPVFASEPVLPDQQFSGLAKQIFQLDQILPRATAQTYGNVVVYSTVGMVSPQKLERWSRSWDILINMIGWWWLDQIPRQFKIVMVSENEYDQLQFVGRGVTGAAAFDYPDELWSRGYNDQDWWVLHEALHRIISWIYYRNNAFSSTRLRNFSPLIIAAAELTTNKLNSELGLNPNSLVIDPVRFNQLWGITKETMNRAGFITGLENVSMPRIADCPPDCSLGNNTIIGRRQFEAYQNFNGTGEIYLAITMFSAILDHYNFHRNKTWLYSIAVCNAKKILDRELGFIRIENPFLNDC